MILNLCFLFGIILVPFSADVLGNFPSSPLSVSVYATNGAFISMMLTIMWSYALVSSRSYCLPMMRVEWDGTI